jgi:selenocysteine lyase/cysteine desulfurase
LAKDSRAMLEKSILEALKTYSNVHRGSGHKSIASTELFEQARKIVLDYLGLNPRNYRVIFCSPYQAEIIENKLRPGTYQILSSQSFGLSIGVRALAVRNGALPQGAPTMSGGGAARLISTEWAIWDSPPAKFEAGTPPVINVIAFARSLQLAQKYGEGLFKENAEQKMTIKELFYQDLLDGFKGKELLNKLRNTRIGLDLKVPTSKGPRSFINLDSSASTPTFGPVWDAFRSTYNADQSSGTKILNEVRKICSEFLGAPSADYEIIFTSNTTEGINLVAGNLACSPAGNLASNTIESQDGTDAEDHQPLILGTLMEHSSNELPWRTVPNHSLIRVPVDREGFVDSKRLADLLEDYNSKGIYGKQRIRLVAVSAASNVLGTCNNLKEISDIAHRFDARLLVDGAQMVAHRKVEIAKNGFDYFAFSAHKIYAPFGCGVLVVRKGLLNYTAQETEKILASGEENLAGIAATGKVLHLLGRIGMELIEKEEQELTAQILSGMQEIPGMKLVGIKEYDEKKLTQRVGVIPFNLGNVVSFSVGKKLALHHGIGVRVGCHCAHILVKHVLGVKPGLEKFQRIMQTVIPSMSFPGVVRVSLGIENTREDVDALLSGLKQISSKSRNEAPTSSPIEVKKIFPDYTAACREKVFGSLE